MKNIPLHIAIVLSVFTSCHNNNSNNESITIFCAAGMTDVITELVDSFQLTHAVDIKLNLASSGTLARQLSMGNEADIYISASKRWADYADSLGLFAYRKKLWQNKLVMVSPKTSSAGSIHFLPNEPPAMTGYLSMGDPAHVPAGKYAQEALAALGWSDAYAGTILPAKDVRSALRNVELGECELGIVYYTDARASGKVDIVGEFPDSTYSPIIMHALLANRSSELTKSFYHMLTDTLYRDIWLKYGLLTVANE